MALPKSLTTVTTFSKLLAMILFILFPFIGFYVGAQYQHMVDQQMKNAGLNLLVKPTPAHIYTVDTSSWKTFTSNQLHFSFQYPSTWNIQEGPFQVDKYNFGRGSITLTGKEGSLKVLLITGIPPGGGCDLQYHTNLTMFNFGLQKDVCHGIKNYSEFWDGIWKRTSGGIIQTSANANAPYQSNSATILAIYSSFMFH